MKYYKVKAKCGHVGRNNYIIKDLYVYAENGKEAALIARNKPRVKHHQKDAIKSVSEVSLEDYIIGISEKKKDPYFQVKNSSEQRQKCLFEEGEIIKEEKENIRKHHDHKKRRLLEMLIIKEWKTQKGLLYE